MKLEQLVEVADSEIIEVKVKGKVIGTVWQSKDGDWAGELNKTGMSWDGIDSKADAIEGIISEYQDTIG